MKDLTQNIDWKKVNELLPVIVQNAEDDRVLMLGYMDKEALKMTFETNEVCFFSRSRGRIWRKGETSGNTLRLVSAALDCDNDSLLVKVLPKGPTCHVGRKSCFKAESQKKNFLQELFALIERRKTMKSPNSYTCSLLEDGLAKICEKVEEEAAEVLKAAKSETKRRLIEESVDLLYHTFVLLVCKRISWDDLRKEVLKRRK